MKNIIIKNLQEENKRLKEELEKMKKLAIENHKKHINTKNDFWDYMDEIEKEKEKC